MNQSTEKKSGGGRGLFTLAGVALGAVATGLGYSAWNTMQATGSLDWPLVGGAGAAAIASLFSLIMGARKPKAAPAQPQAAPEQRRTAPEWGGPDQAPAAGRAPAAGKAPAAAAKSAATAAATAVAGATATAGAAGTGVADTDVPTVQLPGDDPDGAIANLSQVAQGTADTATSTRNVVDVTESLAAAAGMDTTPATVTATSAALSTAGSTALDIDPDADMDIDMAALAGEQSDEQWFDPLTGEGADGAPPSADTVAAAVSDETDPAMDEFNDLVFGGRK